MTDDLPRVRLTRIMPAFFSFLLATLLLTVATYAGRAPAATITYAPSTLDRAVTLGQVVTQTLTVTASGASSATVRFSAYNTLLDRVYGVYATYTDPHLAHFERSQPGTLTDLGVFANGSPAGDFVGDDFSQVYAIANNDPFNNTDDTLVTINTTTGAVTTIGPLGAPAGLEAFGGMSYDARTEKLYAVSSYVDFFGTGGNTLYTVDLTTGVATSVGALVAPSPSEIGDIAFDGAGRLYAHDLTNQALVEITLAPLGFHSIAPLDVAAEFNTGMDWDPITERMYVSVWRTAEGGELRTVDLATGQTTLIGALGGIVPGTPEEVAFTWIAFAAAPAPWLSVAPTELSVPANGQAQATITLDARVLAQPGVYRSWIAFNGAFDNVVASMPVTLQVTCPSCGVLNGAFSDAWTHLPLDARLHVTSTAGMDIHLGARPSYSVTVPAGVYTLTASAAGYWDATQVVTATLGGTTPTALALVPRAGLLTVTGGPLAVTAGVGAVVTRTFTVSNTGTIPLTFTVRLDNLDVPLVVRDATRAALRGERPAVPSAVLPIRAYGVNHDMRIGGELGWFDLSDPTVLTTTGLYHDHGSLGGGDFFGGDFGTLFGFEESRLVAFDTATGAKRYVGALPPISGYTAHQAQAYDPLTDALYVLQAYDCYNPPTTLYRVDPQTASVTAMGTLDDALGCMGDIAFDDSGRLYAIDIDNNTVLELDPNTASARVIGALGFDINSFEQGLEWDSATDQLYLTAVDASTFPSVQKLYFVDVFTGHAAYLSDIGQVAPGAGSAYLAGLALKADVLEWVQVPGAQYTVPAGGATTVALVFDTRSLYRTGVYASDLTFAGTFVNAAPTVPVTLALDCATCGVLRGAIGEAGRAPVAANQATPLAAQVHVTSTNGLDVELYSQTAYSLTVLPGTYTLVVSRAGYVSASALVTVTPNGTTNTSFVLAPDVPLIVLNPEAVVEQVALGDVVTRTFTIQNVGPADFAFSVRDAELSTLAPRPALSACGAPDAFGYACSDSHAAGGPTYTWVDISTTGQDMGLNGANDFYGMIALPFAFDYYGQRYTEVAVSAYGQIYFEDRMADPSFAGHQPIPSQIQDNGVQRFIAPFWDGLDYDPVQNPQAYYAVQGIAPHRRLVVQWNNVTANFANVITFQTILFEDSGNILMQYNTLHGETGDSTTIGIQGSETVGLEYGYNSAVLSDHLAVCYVHPGARDAACGLEPPDALWLSATPATGVVAAHTTTTVTVVLDTRGLTLPGVYRAEVYLGGVEGGPYGVPVQMGVGYQGYLPLVGR